MLVTHCMCPAYNHTPSIEGYWKIQSWRRKKTKHFTETHESKLELPEEWEVQAKTPSLEWEGSWIVPGRTPYPYGSY